MKWLRHFAIAFLWLLPLHAQDSARYTPLLQDLQKIMDAYAQQETGDPGIIPGISAAVRFPDQLDAFSLVSGYADPRDRSVECLQCPIPMSPNMMVEVGSVTKTFTSALLLQFQERGWVNTTDTISRLLPQVVNCKIDGSITLFQLLQMSSGIAGFKGETNYQEGGSFSGFSNFLAEQWVQAYQRDPSLKAQWGRSLTILNNEYMTRAQKIGALKTLPIYQDIQARMQTFAARFSRDGVDIRPLEQMLEATLALMIDLDVAKSGKDINAMRAKFSQVIYNLLIRFNQVNRSFFNDLGLDAYLFEKQHIPFHQQTVAYRMPYTTIGYIGWPTGKPGESWNYTNTDFVIAGMIAEMIASDPLLDTTFRRNFFLKLDPHTMFLGGPEPYDLDMLATSWSAPSQKTKLFNQKLWSRMGFYTSYWTAGSLVTQADNIANWMHLLFGTNDIINEESKKEMGTFYDLPNQIPTTSEGDGIPVVGVSWNGYGLGLMRFMVSKTDTSDLDIELWGYWGATAGFNTLAAYIWDAKVGLIININRRGDQAEANCFKMLRDFTRAILAFQKQQGQN